MNSINFYQGAKILAAGLGTSYVTNYIGNKAAKYFKVDKKAYTNTILKTISFVTGAAAAAFTARHLGVISFSLKNFSFLSKAAAQTSAATPSPIALASEDSPDYLEQLAERFTAKSQQKQSVN